MDDFTPELHSNEEFEILTRVAKLLEKHDEELSKINARLNQILHERNLIKQDWLKLVDYFKNINLDNVPPSFMFGDIDFSDKLDTPISGSASGLKGPETKSARSPVERENSAQLIVSELATNVDLKVPSQKPARVLKYVSGLKNSKSLANMPTNRPETDSVKLDSMLKKVKESADLDATTIDTCINFLSEDTEEKVKDINILVDDAKAIPSKTESDNSLRSVVKSKASEQSNVLLSIKTIDKKDIEPSNDEMTPVSKRDSVMPNLTKKQKEKKHYENSEERKERVQRILFQTPTRKVANNRFTSTSNRIAGEQKQTRNKSLSPLRFSILKENKSQTLQSEPNSPLSSTTDEIRKFKSEQQIFVGDLSSDSCSITDSVMDLEDEGGDSLIADDKEEQHLLAPSKVIKAQEIFNQKFFPQDLREKPLLSKEELAKIKAKKTMVKSKSIGWNMGSSGDTSLLVANENQLRHSSASPERKMRSKEINQLNSIGKFRNYKNFWENKSQEFVKRQEYGKRAIKPSGVVATADTQESPMAKKNRLSSSIVSEIPFKQDAIKQNLATAVIDKNQVSKSKMQLDNLKSGKDHVYVKPNLVSMVLKKIDKGEQLKGAEPTDIHQKRIEKDQNKLAPTRSLDLQYLTKHQKEMSKQCVDVGMQPRFKLARDFSREVLDEKIAVKALPSPNTLLPGGDGKMNKWRAAKQDQNDGKPVLDSARTNLRSTDF